MKTSLKTILVTLITTSSVLSAGSALAGTGALKCDDRAKALSEVIAKSQNQTASGFELGKLTTNGGGAYYEIYQVYVTNGSGFHPYSVYRLKYSTPDCQLIRATEYYDVSSVPDNE